MLQEQNGVLYIIGSLNQSCLLELVNSLSEIASERNVVIDLSRTEEANSMMLAILIDLQRHAKKHAHSLTIIHCPERLLKLIALYSLQPLFNLDSTLVPSSPQ